MIAPTLHCLVIKEFLNELWHKYTCTESYAAIGNARPGCESLRTDIQSIREIDDSGCTLLSEIGNMITNPEKYWPYWSGEAWKLVSYSFLEKKNHTVLTFLTQSNLKDEWESCVSSVEEDECFYDAVSLVNSQDVSYTLFPPGH